MIIHPARAMPYDELMTGLWAAVDAGHANVQEDGDLRLFCYSKSCAYDRAWTPFTAMARGLIVDVVAERVVATPFPKFFNVGERGEGWPDLPFETFEKLDGSLIIIFHHGGRWRCATKGSFSSDQAKAAQALLDANAGALDYWFTPGETWLAEYVAPDNRIVVHYDRPELVLLGVYAEDGKELSADTIFAASISMSWRAAAQIYYTSVSELLALAPTLPASQEGFVLRFGDGTRLKVKGDEYKRIHALVSRITPLAMWEAMAAGDDLDAIRRQLPEEFWVDFDAIVAALESSVTEIEDATATTAWALAGHDDKMVGLALKDIEPAVRAFIFPMRNHGGLRHHPRTRAALYRAVRPTGNRLAGYTPSYTINRAMEEAA